MEYLADQQQTGDDWTPVTLLWVVDEIFEVNTKAAEALYQTT